MADFSAVSRAKDTDRLLAGPGVTCYQVRSAVGSRSNQPAPLRDAEAARVFASFSGQIQLFDETVSRTAANYPAGPIYLAARMTLPAQSRQPPSSRSNLIAPRLAEWRSTLLYCGALVLATLAVYSQAWNLSFINVDDPEYATLNPYVQAGLTIKGLRWSLGVHDCNWIPLTWLSLMLDSQIFGTT